MTDLFLRVSLGALSRLRFGARRVTLAERVAKRRLRHVVLSELQTLSGRNSNGLGLDRSHVHDAAQVV